VHVFNHRSVADIFRMIRTLGGMIGREARTAALVDELARHLDEVRARAARFTRRPRVYFEEWDDPQISGIRWVSELIGIAGGDDCFPELSIEPLAKNRIIADIAEVPRRRPDLVLGSWCGKKFQPRAVRERPGWQEVPAVMNGDLHEVKSSIILQPGPAALTEGVDAIHAIVSRWCERR
jgi:iron complex transport system substrate-binding protein